MTELIVIDSYTVSFPRRNDDYSCSGDDVEIHLEIKAKEKFLDRFDSDLIRTKMDYICSLVGKRGNERGTEVDI